MARFKMLRGKKVDLPTILTDGYTYFCTDTGEIFVDCLDEQGQVVRKKVSAEKVDVNNNVISGDQESNKVNESGTLNSVEGKENFVGISRLPSIQGSVYETNAIDENLYSNYLDLSEVKFGEFIYYNKLTESDGLYTYTVNQASVESIIDKSGTTHFNDDNYSYENNQIVNFNPTPKIIYELQFTDVEKYDYIISAGESFTFSGDYIVMSFNSTMFTGEINNISHVHMEGVNNTVLSNNSHVEGNGNIAGARAYRILESNISELSYTLNDVTGLEVGDIFSIKINSVYDDHGKITAIDDDNNKVFVDNFIGDNLVNIEGYEETSISNTFRVISKPFLGTIDWASSGHAEGSLNRLYADNAHVEGYNNTVIGRYGHAEGIKNKAGYASHAQNRGNKAIGIDSTATGYYTETTGDRSYTMGYRTIASGDNQLVRGKYNIPDDTNKYADIIGNGVSENRRSNAYTLDWNGNAEYAGNIIANGKISASDMELKSLNTGLELYGSISLDNGNIIHTNTVSEIIVDGNSIFNTPTEIEPLYGIDGYRDKLTIGDKITQTHRIRKVVLNSTVKKGTWMHSTSKSTDSYNAFFINLHLSKYLDGSMILSEDEIAGIPFAYADGARGFWDLGNGYIPLTLNASKHDKDGNFWIEQTESPSLSTAVFRVWFVSWKGEGYSNITNVDEMKATPIELYFALREPKVEVLSGKFTGVWDTFREMYTKETTVSVNGLLSNSVNTIIENGIGHNLSDALSKLSEIDFEIPEDLEVNSIRSNNGTINTINSDIANIDTADIINITANTGDIDTINSDSINSNKINVLDKLIIKGTFDETTNTPVNAFDYIKFNDEIINQKLNPKIELPGLNNYQDILHIEKNKIVLYKNIRKIKLGSNVSYTSWNQTSSNGALTNKFFLNLADAKYTDKSTLLTDKELELINNNEHCFYIEDAKLGKYTYVDSTSKLKDNTFALSLGASNNISYLRLYIEDSNLSNIRDARSSSLPTIKPENMPEGSIDIRTMDLTLYIATKFSTVEEIEITSELKDELNKFICNYTSNSMISIGCTSEGSTNIIEIPAEVGFGNIFDSIPSEITVDSTMSNDSANPVQNKVIKKYIDDINIDLSNKINNSESGSNTSFKLVNTVLDLPYEASSGDTSVVIADSEDKNGLYLYVNNTWNKLAMEATTLTPENVELFYTYSSSGAGYKVGLKDGFKTALNNNADYVVDGETLWTVGSALPNPGSTYSGLPVTSMNSMFRDCDSLKKLDLSNFDTSSVTNMNSMFRDCQALTELDVSGFNTSNVTDMGYMFDHCKALTTLDVSGFNTSKVTNMHDMFDHCEALTTLDVSSFNTSNVTDMGYMFYFCDTLTKLDLSNFDTSSVTNMSNMFYFCDTLTKLDLSNFDTSSVTNMDCMFDHCKALTTLDVSSFNTSNVKDMGYMFNECYALTTLDLSNFDTSSVTDMTNMFAGCHALTTLDLSSFDTSSVTNMTYMFSGRYALTTLDLSSFDTSSVTNMTGMFNECRALTTLDLSSFDTSSVTNMYGMFRNCYALTTLDLSSFDTSSVTNMDCMFDHCKALTTLDVSSFNTSNVKDMGYMFSGCYALTTLDLSSFDTSSVTDMTNMFAGCHALTTLDLSSFDTSSVTNMTYMFSGCHALTPLDLSSFDTSSVTDMTNMFSSCYALTTLDLSSFDTSSVTNIDRMFAECNNLTSIVARTNEDKANFEASPIFPSGCTVTVK